MIKPDIQNLTKDDRLREKWKSILHTFKYTHDASVWWIVLYYIHISRSNFSSVALEKKHVKIRDHTQ